MYMRQSFFFSKSKVYGDRQFLGTKVEKVTLCYTSENSWQAMARVHLGFQSSGPWLKPAECMSASWLDDLCSNELFASTAGNVGTTLCDHPLQLLLLPGCWSSLFLPRWSSHTCWAHLSPSTMTRTDHIIRTFNALLGNAALNTTTISPAFAFHSSW